MASELKVTWGMIAAMEGLIRRQKEMRKLAEETEGGNTIYRPEEIPGKNHKPKTFRRPRVLRYGR